MNRRSIGSALSLFFTAALLCIFAASVSADAGSGYTQGWLGAPDWVLERMDTSIMPDLYIPKNTSEQAESVPPSVGAYIREGNNLLTSGSYGGAKNSFEKAINLKANSFDAWAGRGMALEGLKRYQSALDSYEKAISFAGENAGAWIAYAGKGRVCYHLKEYGDAEKALERAIDRFAGSGEVNIEDLINMYEKLSDSREKLGDSAGAADAAKKAADLRAALDNS